MASTKKILWITAGIAFLLLMTKAAYSNVLKTFLPTWEGFSAIPYWDYKQWSWGYGTRVPGSIADKNINPGGTITRAKAMEAALNHLQTDYLYLKPLIWRNLTGNQWAALLSFSYNLGPGNADNLVPNINSNNLVALESQWKEYINAGGVPNDTLIRRRAAEWDLYIS